jgi:hypothetical protein
MDMEVVYGLLWSPTGLELWRCSPFHAVMIQACDWKQQKGEAWAKLLFSYVYKVYESIEKRDTTTEYLPDKEAWRIKVKEVAYIMRPFYVSRPPGRCTAVFVGYREDDTSSNPKLYIIKDLWVSGTRFLEFKLFEEAHAKNPVPGLAQLEAHEEIYIFEDEETKSSMTKHRYVTGNVGEPITQCESVLEILYLMYDLTVSKYTLINALIADI